MQRAGRHWAALTWSSMKTHAHPAPSNWSHWSSGSTAGSTGWDGCDEWNFNSMQEKNDCGDTLHYIGRHCLSASIWWLQSNCSTVRTCQNCPIASRGSWHLVCLWGKHKPSLLQTISLNTYSRRLWYGTTSRALRIPTGIATVFEVSKTIGSIIPNFTVNRCKMI